MKDSKIKERSAKKSIIIIVNKEGNWILQIRISYEEKHGVDDEINLSYDENNIAKPPPWCYVDLLANNTLKP